MKKRSKIIALVTTLCLCLSMFVVGVLAAKSATFNVTSTLNFTADGVYVMVDASLKQGADVGTAAVLTEGAPTQPRFKAYSYPRESGQDYPNGEPSTTHFVNESGAQADTWAIGDINYTSTNKVVVYEFMVYNYSNFEVIGTVEGISEALASYTDQLSITTYTGTTSADATATGSPTYSFTIPARTNETTHGVTCYKIAVTLNNFMNPLSTDTIVMNVKFEKPPEPVYEYFTYSYSDSGNSITGFSDDYLTLETKPETLVIPNTDAEGTNITSIKSGSSSSPTFEGLASSKVIIQEGITSIGQYAFRNCSSLTSIVIPEGITSIGIYAFYGCSGLTNVTLPSSLTSIDSGVFYKCSGLTGELVIPKGVTSIGNDAFQNCTSLESVSLPSSLTSIGQNAFSGCSGLTGELVIPEGVISIGNFAFFNCSSLTGELVIPKGVENIGNSAFQNCTSLESVSLPSSLTSIGQNAFSGCSGLTGELVIPEGVTSIGDFAFNSCSGLTGELVIPEGVTSIESSAFQSCSGLTSVSLPSKLTSIGSSAFNGCSGLTSVSLPSSLTSIGSYAFSGCIGLTGKLVIPEKVTSIGSRAFQSCRGLTSVSLPSTLTSIGDFAFSGCSSLKYIQITGNLTSPYTFSSGTWVKTDSATEPTDWTTNVVTSISASDSIGYYHQKSGWESAI